MQALQDACPDDAELVHYTEVIDETDAPPLVENDDTPFKYQCMLSWEPYHLKNLVLQSQLCWATLWLLH